MDTLIAKSRAKSIVVRIPEKASTFSAGNLVTIIEHVAEGVFPIFGINSHDKSGISFCVEDIGVLRI